MYLNPYEVHCEDQTHDVSCVGMVNNFTRTNNTAANGQIWEGYMVQSLGTKAMDCGFCLRGDVTIGIDLAAQNWPSPVPSAPAIAMAPNTYVYPDATNVNASHFSRYTAIGTTSWGYNSADAAIETTVGGTMVEQATSTYVHLPSALNAGHLSCTPSASVSCTTNPTAVVFPGAHCYANYDSSTVAAQSTLLPVLIQIVGTTLTLCPQTTTAQSNLLSMTYSCI